MYKDKGGVVQYFTDLDINNTKIDDFMYSRFGLNTTFNSSISDYLKEFMNNMSGFK